MLRRFLTTSLAVACLSALAPARAAAQLPASTRSRDQRWRADLAYFARELPARHKNAFAYVKAEDFQRAVRELDAAIPSLTDQQVAWRFQRLAALVRDGHTRVGVPFPYRLRVPLSLFWDASGLYVVAAPPEQQPLVGKRIQAINGVPLAAVRDTLTHYASHENPVGLQEWGSAFVLWPGLLRDLGVGRDSARASLRVADSAGAPTTVELAAESGPAYQPAPAGAPRPLYLRRTRERYWFTYLPESRTVYFQYNRCLQPDTFRLLTDSLARVLDSQHPARLVVDLRANAGGNSQVIQPLIALIRTHPELARPGALYAVVGRGTFSSGTMGVVDLKQKAHAVLVGEPNGERPNHYGEVRQFKLPYSGLTVSYSTKNFREVPGDPDAVYPDVSTPLTAALMIAGRDPVMEWILAQPLPAGS